MTVERWKQVKRVLHRVMLVIPEHRARFLDEACHSDASLRAEVESLLLAQDDVRTSFLESPPRTAGQSAQRDSELPSPGRPSKLGPYEILEPIAKGGMGEVYRARDTRLGRYVAVKILPADLSWDPDRQARFKNEARAASALNHPNIVLVYDFGRDSGTPFIVSELIEGESLRRLIAKGPVPVAQLVDIAIQLATGLGAAHAAGIVHRDLKPENIMLTPDMRVKILDFGLAKHIFQRRSASESTETQIVTAPGLLMGTVGYLSPEQVRGETVDERSDIFSVGAVLYELAAGKRAFTGDKAIDVLSAILREEPAELRAGIPRVLDRIIRRCLEKDAQRRFQNAASLVAALKGIGEISRMRLAFGTIGRKRLAWWASAAVPAAILVACGLWFIPRGLNWHAPASATLPQSKPRPTQSQSTQHQPTQPQPRSAAARPIVVQPTVEPKQPATAERIVDAEAKKVPALATPPEPRKTDSPVIETLAGRPLKFTGDGMPARQVALGHCDDMQCDREGNIYASDWGNEIIFKIDRNGILHVLAGPESAPSDRPVNPRGIAVDRWGDVYFSEVFSIRKLLPGGHVIPFAGNHTPGFAADGARAEVAALAGVSGIVLAPDGSVIFSEHDSQRVRRVDSQGRLRTVAGNGQRGFSGDAGPAQQASLAGPRDLALDSAGNLFIADQDNRCVRKVSADGRIATVAGQGVAGTLSCPSGLAVNRKGDLFVADSCRRRVVVVRDGKISPVGGTRANHEEPSGDGGPATAASFDEWKLALDEKENLLVSDPNFGHIYRISQDGRFSIIAGSGRWGVTRDGTPARQAVFQEPFRLAVDGAGNIFMTDLKANRIYRIDAKGIVTEVAGYQHFGYDGEDTPARTYRLNGPNGIRVSPHGSVVFADSLNNRVREVTSDGRLRTLAGNGTRGFSGDGGRAVEAALNRPVGVCLDKAGNVYIADTDNHRVRKVMPDGRIVTVAGNGVPAYSGDGGPAERASLKLPRAVEVDPNGNLYIADLANHVVRRVSAGVIATVAGDGHPGYSGDGALAAKARLNLPGDLALSADRQLYILDRPTHRIRRMDLVSGIITTFAGNGEGIASGDGGPPTKAGLGDPAGIAVDGAGNVYVTDGESKQLRIIRP